MTIQAIETRYAGCRFRSRLEARWAVFFDHLDIRWEYEPQGLAVSYRLTRERDEGFSYLPDFWLPDIGLWAEVKGSLTDGECVRLLDIAASISSNDGGGCHDAGGHDLLVLGPIPRIELTGTVGVPWRLHMHKGDLIGVAWLAADWPQQPHGSSCPGSLKWAAFAGDCGGSLTELADGYDFDGSQIPAILLRGLVVSSAPVPAMVRAYHAARSARFEYGEAG